MPSGFLIEASLLSFIRFGELKIDYDAAKQSLLQNSNLHRAKRYWRRVAKGRFVLR